MISLIGSQICRSPGILSRVRGRKPGYTLRQEYILGMRVICADLCVYESSGSRRQRRGQKRELERIYTELFRRNIGQILFSRDFPAEAEFDKFQKADTICLYESVAGAVGELIALEVGREEAEGGSPERSQKESDRTAAFIAGSMGIREERSLIKLAENYRYLIVVAGRDSEIICQSLRRRFGIAVIDSPTESQYLKADFAVLLSKPRRDFELRPDCLIYSPNINYTAGIMGGRRIEALRLNIPESVREEIPRNFDWPPIISEAIKCGFYSPDDIEVLGYKLEGNGRSAIIL